MNAPEKIYIPPLYAGRSAVVRWDAAEGAEGYLLQRRFDAGFADVEPGYGWLELEERFGDWDALEAGVGSWDALEAWGGDFDVYRGPDCVFADYIPDGAARAAYRVLAFGGGGESGWSGVARAEITPNRPPVLDGERGDLGRRYRGFRLVFSVTDPDPEDVVTVRATLGERLLFDSAVEQGAEYGVEVPDDAVAALEIGARGEVVLTATDARGLQDELRCTFVAEENFVESAVFYVLRDGVPVARLERPGEWTDYTQVGRHTYVVRGVDRFDNFVDSNPVTVDIGVERATLAPLADPGAMLELRCRRGAPPLVRCSRLPGVSLRHFEGRALPVAADSGARQARWRLAFTHRSMADCRALCALAQAGEPVVYRDAFGNRLVGWLTAATDEYLYRYAGEGAAVDFGAELTEADCREEVDYD